jgi:hypothetical protein
MEIWNQVNSIRRVLIFKKVSVKAWLLRFRPIIAGDARVGVFFVVGRVAGGHRALPEREKFGHNNGFSRTKSLFVIASI